MAGLEIKKVLISDAVDQAAVDKLKERGIQVDLQPGLSKAALLDTIKDYDALIVRSSTQVTEEVINAAKQLKLIGRAGVGVDNIDCAAATRRGIIVINAPGGNTISAAELTCGMIVALSRNIPQACAALKSGLWDRKTYAGTELQGKTLGIVGLGRIGREVGMRMQSFGMKTIGYDPITPPEVARAANIEPLPLEEIWPQADYITFHTPLIPATKYMLNENTFAKCKKGVKIINCARGGIVSEDALLTALQRGQCGGAALDVYEEEPPKNSSLLSNSKLICTPHLGASTKEAQLRVAQEIAEQFIDLMDGKPVPGVVNAPLLGQMLRPESRPLSNLGEYLGMLAASLLPKVNEFKAYLTGPCLGKSSDLITAATKVGLVKGRRLLSNDPLDGINLISAPTLIEKAGMTVESGVYDGFPPNSLTVYGQGLSIVGFARGDGIYLHNINKNYFRPSIQLSGNMFFFESEEKRDAILAAIAGSKLKVNSVSLGKVLHVINVEELPSSVNPLPGLKVTNSASIPFP